MFVSSALQRAHSPLAMPFLYFWIAYAIYSWVWPPILRRLL
jgi:hypothetical protein